MQAVLDILHKARDRGGRAVLLVPRASYETALKALACMYSTNAGRTARMPDGNLVSVVTPVLSVDDFDNLKDGFDLYLAGWGTATPLDEQGMRGWIAKARQVFTEIDETR